MNSRDSSQEATFARARELLDARELTDARQAFEAALRKAPGKAGDYNDYGRLLNNLREFEQARQAFASAIALKPDFAEAHNNLGHVLRAMNEADEAAACFRTAVGLRPGYALAWQNLGTVLALTGDYHEAIEALEKCLALTPGDPDAHLNLAGLYRVTDLLAKAEDHMRSAIRVAPALIDARIQLASLLESRGELDEATNCYRAALNIDGFNSEALAGLADVMDKTGRYEEGLELLAPALARSPLDPHLAVAQARLLRRIGRVAEAMRLLATIQSDRPDESERQPRFFFTLGDLYDEQAKYDEAFTSYVRANELKKETFNAIDVTEAVNALISVFTEEFLRSARSSLNTSPLPIFVVGMPRSGTSLVEQILASHPSVFGAGELRLIVDMVRSMGKDQSFTNFYPECVPALTDQRLCELADSYLGALSAMSAGATRITDKMPHNFLHLGLIHMLLPAASVIHCVRHPLDTILSCYFQDFASSAMAFTNNMEHLTIYYEQYHRLMQHWQNVLPHPIFEVHYESLVDDPKTVVEKMLEHVGLRWDDRVLDFHETKRLVKTASHAQVRQPIYKRSVARHENYARHLSIPKERLGALLDRPDL